MFISDYKTVSIALSWHGVIEEVSHEELIRLAALQWKILRSVKTSDAWLYILIYRFQRSFNLTANSATKKQTAIHQSWLNQHCARYLALTDCLGRSMPTHSCLQFDTERENTFPEGMTFNYTAENCRVIGVLQSSSCVPCVLIVIFPLS